MRAPGWQRSARDLNIDAHLSSYLAPSDGLLVRVPRNDREFHRRVAAECFNRAWDLLEKGERSESDDLQLLHLSHASRYHWGIVGEARNRAVGEWQLSRVYAELGQPELSLRFARTCLVTCSDNGLSDIVHTAHEAMARACAVAKDYGNAEKHLAVARRRLDRLSLAKDEKSVYLNQIEETERLIKNR